MKMGSKDEENYALGLACVENRGHFQYRELIKQLLVLEFVKQHKVRPHDARNLIKVGCVWDCVLWSMSDTPGLLMIPHEVPMKCNDHFLARVPALSFQGNQGVEVRKMMHILNLSIQTL